MWPFVMVALLAPRPPPPPRRQPVAVRSPPSPITVVDRAAVPPGPDRELRDDARRVLVGRRPLHHQGRRPVPVDADAGHRPAARLGVRHGLAPDRRDARADPHQGPPARRRRRCRADRPRRAVLAPPHRHRRRRRPRGCSAAGSSSPTWPRCPDRRGHPRPARSPARCSATRCCCGSASAATGCTCTTGRSSRSSAGSPAAAVGRPVRRRDGRHRRRHRALVPLHRDADPPRPRRPVVAPPPVGARPRRGRSSPASAAVVVGPLGVRRGHPGDRPAQARTRSPSRSMTVEFTTGLLDVNQHPRSPTTTGPRRRPRADDDRPPTTRPRRPRCRRPPTRPARDHRRRRATVPRSTDRRPRRPCRRRRPPPDPLAWSTTSTVTPTTLPPPPPPDHGHRRLRDARRRRRAAAKGILRRRRRQPADEDDDARRAGAPRHGQLGDAVVVHLGTNGPRRRDARRVLRSLSGVPGGGRAHVKAAATTSPPTTPSSAPLPAQFPNVRSSTGTAWQPVPGQLLLRRRHPPPPGRPGLLHRA